MGASERPSYWMVVMLRVGSGKGFAIAGFRARLNCWCVSVLIILGLPFIIWACVFKVQFK